MVWACARSVPVPAMSWAIAQTDDVADVGLGQVDMLAADQVDVVGGPVESGLYHQCGHGHEGAGLPKAFVFLEQCQDVLE
jgi:hypothetical protein